MNVPLYVNLIFILTVILTLFLFFKAAKLSKTILLIVLIWIFIQSILGLNEFYTNTNSLPPRFILLILPPFVSIPILFITKSGKQFIDSLDLKTLTIMHTIRIFVEIVLYWLFVFKKVPILMTYEGRNFDIISGLTAPFVYYFGFINVKMSKKIIIIWNYLCLALLINIVFNSVLSSPFPLQRFGFEQPNIAILYFPFVLLPSVIVPIVLFSHLVAIRRLGKEI